MKIKLCKRNFFCFLMIALLVVSVSSALAGNEQATFPDKPIYIIVGAGPGGGSDIPARALAASAPEFLNNQPVIVVNRPGSNGMVAAKYVANQAPDGYTLLMGWGGPEYTFGRHVQKLPIDLFNDFKPVTGVISYSSCIAVPSSSPFKTLNDLVEYAKKNPGKLTWTHTGKAGTHWINGANFFKLANIKLTEVPNATGGANARNMVAGGHVDVGFFATFLAKPVLGDKLRILAVAFPQRDGIVPDVPTFQEEGYDIANAYDIKLLAASAGTPDWKIKRLFEGFKKAMDSTSFKSIVENANFTTLGLDPEETLKLVEDKDDQFGKLAKDLLK